MQKFISAIIKFNCAVYPYSLHGEELFSWIFIYSLSTRKGITDVYFYNLYDPSILIEQLYVAIFL